MTRIKKTRSLKRIHQVKTGSKQKLKRSADNDRQTGKGKKKTLSVYEKYLLEKKKTNGSGNTQKKLTGSKKASPQTPSFKKAKDELNQKKQKRLEKIQRPVPIKEEPINDEELDLFEKFENNNDTF